jgi:transcription initiation factor IIE alpha subunit
MMKSRRLKACPRCETYVKLEKENLEGGKVKLLCPKCDWTYDYMERRRFKKIYPEEGI